MAIFLLACALYGQMPSPESTTHVREKERALGAQLGAEFRRKTTPFESPTTLAWLNSLVKRLVPNTELFYSVELIQDDDTLLHEPVSLPGGFLFVPASLILAAQSEDEVAGMLAHSIAHVEARHGARYDLKLQAGNRASMPLIFMGGWYGFAVGKGASAVPLGLVQQHRAFELDADRLAAQMMSAAGYNPQSLAGYVEREQLPDPPQPGPSYLLPARAERVVAIRSLSTGRDYPVHPPLTEFKDEVRRRLAR